MAKTKKQTKPKKKSPSTKKVAAKKTDFAQALASVDSPKVSSNVQPKTAGVTSSQLNNLKEFPKAYLLAGLVVLAGAFVVGYNWWQTTQNVVARVNGQPIPRSAFIDQLEKQAGEQVLDQMITEKLIQLSANQAGIVIDEAQIDSEIASISAQLASSGQDFQEALAMRGMSEEDLRYQIRIQKQIEQLAGVSQEVTEEEINEYLETNSAFLPEDATLEEQREIAREQLMSERKQDQIQQYLATLRQNAQIENLLFPPAPQLQSQPEVTIDEVPEIEENTQEAQ